MRSHVDESALVSLLKDMVRIDSVNPSLVPGAAGEAEMAEYCADYMRSLGLETIVYDVEPGRPNAVGFLKGGGGGRTLLLNGHTDTVGVDYMTIDPFQPEVRDGKLYGRGAFDMKGGLAASMAALKAVVDSGAPLKGDVILAAVCDEEYASIGTERLMEDVTADGAIIGEFTGGDIQVAHKGFAWIDVETHGVAAHGSRYWEGVDAISKMGKVLAAIDALGENLLAVEHPLVGPASVHASIIEGGRELSTYPDHCKLQVERRLIPGETKATVEGELHGMMKTIGAGDPKFQAEHEITFYRGPMEISRDEEICRLIHEGTVKITGEAPSYIGGTGWMDSEIIWNKGIPVVCHGPSGSGAHAKSEWVDLESVVNVAKVHEYAIKEFCGVEE
ncbi:ArgE/DapE family deacylase [Candidatus Bathyarchaeota archaeon]|nr:ArgE/DapE family deacylase [Candidatus Bathyarchaeota archaeon]MBL7168381.1 ArgE/DapE family deacylase [Candidatus Bathyarchaeota archaeon]